MLRFTQLECRMGRTHEGYPHRIDPSLNRFANDRRLIYRWISLDGRRALFDGGGEAMLDTDAEKAILLTGGFQMYACKNVPSLLGGSYGGSSEHSLSWHCARSDRLTIPIMVSDATVHSA